MVVALIGCASTVSSNSSEPSNPFEMIQQSLFSDDNIANNILQSARRKYAAMKRLEMKNESPRSTHPETANRAGAARAAFLKKTQKVQDRKAIDAVLKGGNADKQTLVSRLEAAIANHKLSTRGLVEAVREAQKV